MNPVLADWQPIASAPMDGTRVLVAHQLDPTSLRTGGIFETTGTFDGGQWHCSAGFVCTDGMLRFDPTHWQPKPSAARPELPA